MPGVVLAAMLLPATEKVPLPVRAEARATSALEADAPAIAPGVAASVNSRLSPEATRLKVCV